MHIIKDENGNICEHAHSHEHVHTHTYEHSHPHDHEHGHEDDHSHTHDHEHSHTHEHGCPAEGTAHCHSHGEGGHCHSHGESGHCHAEAPKNQNEALLKYMLDHNTHHAAELDQVAAKIAADGHPEVAEQIRKAVDEFQKGNLYLGLALSMLK